MYALKKMNPKSAINPEKAVYFAAVVYTTFVFGSMAMMSIGAGLVFAVWVFCRFGKLKSELKAYGKSPLALPSLVLSAACLWSLIWASISGLEFYGEKPKIDWVQDSRKLWHIAFPFIFAALLSRLSETRLRRVTKIWLFAGLASALLGIAQYYVPFYKPMLLPHTVYEGYSQGGGLWGALRGKYHATGLAGFHLSYASIMAFPALVWLSIAAVLYRRVGVKKSVAIASGVFLLFFLANILTYSKIAWISMPLAAMATALFGFKGRSRVVVIAAVVVASIAWSTSSEFQLRFKGLYGDNYSIKERFAVWSANVEMIKQHPFFGVGWHHNAALTEPYFRSTGELNPFVSHAHNNLLDQWASTGLLGMLAFLWWNCVVFVMSFRIYKFNHTLLWRGLGLGLMSGWLCLHLNGLTQSNWWDAKVLHQITWITALTLELHRRHQAHAAARQKR
ncbi:MAG: O-antigen ligase family protein [Bdellovibrionota bacterium]